jgi:hypothetical protein
MIQTNTAVRHYMQSINGPEDIEMLGFSRDFRPFKPVPIYDADGDGIEDNITLTHSQLDSFYKPNVFGAPIEHIFNTRHGNMPGERNKWFYDS